MIKSMTVLTALNIEKINASASAAMVARASAAMAKKALAPTEPALALSCTGGYNRRMASRMASPVVITRF